MSIGFFVFIIFLASTAAIDATFAAIFKPRKSTGFTAIIWAIVSYIYLSHRGATLPEVVGVISSVAAMGFLISWFRASLKENV